MVDIVNGSYIPIQQINGIEGLEGTAQGSI